VEFAILGPLQVRRHGRNIPLRRGRPRALLTALLLRAGKVVSTDVLIDEVWGEQGLTNAANTLQVQVSYLRRALGLPATGDAPALRTVAGGYVLDVEPDSVDVHRFERLVTSAAGRLTKGEHLDAGAALAELREALDLWRGRPLQDVAYEQFAVADVDRLDELRAAALEYEIDARLLLGQHELAVPALRQLIAEHPLRERFRAQLVVALYRSGRQADALRELDDARARLVEELGVDPGPELQRLQRAVLGHDPDLDWRPPPSTGEQPAGVPAAPHPFPSARLPAPTTRLIGRERELLRIQAALGANRMVTLTGTGGAGKTRLALAVAHDQAADRPVWLVELADVGDAQVVPFEIARAVGVATEGDPFAALVLAIGAQRALVVLDTCEHLVEACASASLRLLRGCPSLAVLATSRQPLAVPGEVAWPVPPLAVPPVDAAPEDIFETESVRLFRDRARAVRPDFDVDAGNASDVAAICRVLDGLPLAIELAAARTSVLSPAAIVDRLDDRFTLLRKVGRAADVRQQSLRAAIQWSHDLLDDEARRFFDRLGAFAGRFGLAAATRVAGEGLGADPLDLLSAVVDRSLVVADGDDSYRMLESLREFAFDQLEPAERDTIRSRLAEWLAEYCEARDARIRGTGGDPVFDQLRAETPNLRAALDWCFTAGDRRVGVRLVCSLAWFWGAVGANEEANRWLRRALDTPGVDGATRARLLEGVALHAFSSGATAAGRRAADEAARLWSATGSPHGGFAMLIYRGLGERAGGDLPAAAATLDRAVGIARAGYGDWALAVTLYWRAATAADQEDDELAVELLDEALDLATRADDGRAVGSIVHQLGRVALRQGDAERALELARRALVIHEAVGWSAGITAAHEAIGRALTAGGRPAEAIASLRLGLHRAIELGTGDGMAKALEGLAEARAAAGDPQAAAETLGTAAAVRAGADVPASATQLRVVDAVAGLARRDLGAEEFAAAFERGQLQAPGDVLAGST
jgi:predicted ATPase/DNA-binding SARP family transcriptional activator